MRTVTPGPKDVANLVEQGLHLLAGLEGLGHVFVPSITVTPGMV